MFSFAYTQTLSDPLGFWHEIFIQKLRRTEPLSFGTQSVWLCNLNMTWHSCLHLRAYTLQHLLNLWCSTTFFSLFLQHYSTFFKRNAPVQHLNLLTYPHPIYILQSTSRPPGSTLHSSTFCSFYNHLHNTFFLILLNLLILFIILLSRSILTVY